jgi:hypothetical protein
MLNRRQTILGAAVGTIAPTWVSQARGRTVGGKIVIRALKCRVQSVECVPVVAYLASHCG